MTPAYSKAHRQNHGKPTQRSKSHVWIYGLHAVRAALNNDARKKHRLVMTKNAAAKLSNMIAQRHVPIVISEVQKMAPLLPAGAVHQGMALKAEPLEWPTLKFLCANIRPDSRVIFLDRVSDPHNVGAILRSARAFDVDAVIAPSRHAPPETGALAKSASGALEHVPYLRVSNLATAMSELSKELFTLIGFDSGAPNQIGDIPKDVLQGRVGLVLGSESVGLRNLTSRKCHWMINVCSGSLNVSNAAAVAMHITQRIVNC